LKAGDPACPLLPSIDTDIVLDVEGVTKLVHLLMPEPLVSGLRAFSEANDSCLKCQSPEIDKFRNILRDMCDIYFPGQAPGRSVTHNKNLPLDLHYDRGNIPGSITCVVGLSRDVNGGLLVCPELGCCFARRDRTLTMFCGDQVLHGVTPIQLLNNMSYRSSIVYYSLK